MQSICGLLLSMFFDVCFCKCVCLSVDHNREFYKNGLTDRGAIWDMDSGGSKEPCLVRGPGSPLANGQFRGTSPTLHTRLTHTFNGPLSRTTRVGRYQKGKTNLDFTEARDSEWQ